MSIIQALRPHQWIKNILIFVPLITAHKIMDAQMLMNACIAFLVFCMCASSAYVCNDLVDIQADREHPRKKNRPFASGALSASFGVVLSIGLVVVGMAIAYTKLPIDFFVLLWIYIALTTFYSLGLKKMVILDVIILTSLYTLRIFAGGMVTGIPLTSWLLAFCMFLFGSLALQKRYIEVVMVQSNGGGDVHGRGYRSGDAPILAALGVGSGLLSVLIFALYINAPRADTLYQQSYLLWLVCPLFAYWIGRMWLLAGRGEHFEDPLLFAIRDPVSYIVAVCIGMLLIVAV